MSEMIYCRGCGTQVHQTAVSCPKCGAACGARKSKWVAVALGLLLGSLGAHKFYLGRPWWGLLYLLTCWTFVPAVVALIEVVIYLFTDETDFAIKHAPRHPAHRNQQPAAPSGSDRQSGDAAFRGW